MSAIWILFIIVAVNQNFYCMLAIRAFHYLSLLYFRFPRLSLRLWWNQFLRRLPCQTLHFCYLHVHTTGFINVWHAHTLWHVTHFMLRLPFCYLWKPRSGPRLRRPPILYLQTGHCSFILPILLPGLSTPAHFNWWCLEASLPWADYAWLCVARVFWAGSLLWRRCSTKPILPHISVYQRAFRISLRRQSIMLRR